MIQIDSFELPITPQDACLFLQEETDKFGVFFDVDRCYELCALLQMQNLKAARNMHNLSHYPNLDVNKRQSILDCLQFMGVQTADLYNKVSGKLSIDKANRDKIIESSKYPQDIKAFLAEYETYSSNKRNHGYLLNIARLVPALGISNTKHRMSIGYPTWKVLSTSRISASDPGVQGIPRGMGDIVTEPRGYHLIRCDSGQIEPRINFSTYVRDELIMKLIQHYDDAYFGLLHFCLMSEEEEAKCRENFDANFKPIDITDAMKEQRQNIKRLTNAGSYGSHNLGSINSELADAYNAKIVNHPARIALELKVRQQVNSGTTTFYGMFGTPVTPDSTERYTQGSSGWTEHLIRCGINNPVQTTASELMMFSISEARKILSEAKDSHVCYYKHDEACFYVSDEDMVNGIGDKLADITAYSVKGWIPIKAEAEWGVKPATLPTCLS